jgi:hypothetical protein
MFVALDTGEPTLQLHVVINWAQIPRVKLPLLLQYLHGRAAYSRFTCVNVTIDRGSAFGFRCEELVVDRGNFQGNALARIAGYLDCPRRVPLGNQGLWKFEKSCTEVIILGVGHPEGFDHPNLVYRKYKNVSGISAIGPLAEYLHRSIVARYLRDGGRVRVQICHAGSAKIPDSVYSFARVVAGNFQCSAPSCFSVVHPSGAFIDVLCTMKDFEKRVCKLFHRSENNGTELVLPGTVRLERYQPRPQAPRDFEDIPSDEEDFVDEQLVEVSKDD